MNIARQKFVSIFYCYASEDAALCSILNTHLDPLRQKGWIQSWQESDIPAGTDREREIETRLRMAQVILLLVSPDFLASESCRRQMHITLQRFQTAEAVIIPILLRFADWENTPLQGLQMLPRDKRPVTSWDDKDEAMFKVAAEIEAVVKTLLKSADAQISPSNTQVLPLTNPRNPYKGLAPFTQQNTKDFFGRDQFIQELVDALREMLNTSKDGQQVPRLLAVIGPSGSGKSSVVMAGLLPRLQQGALPGSSSWLYLDPIVPGDDPLKELAQSLAQKLPERGPVALREDLKHADGLHLWTEHLAAKTDTKVVLAVDQFEELFTLTRSEEDRKRFIDGIMTAVSELRGRLLVILTLRADFYDRPMLYPQLARTLQQQHRPVLPMDLNDLRDVIRKPAELPDVQLRFEDDLVGNILSELQEQSGALPLLQFTLYQLFQHRRGNLLTIEAYHALGGVRGALAKQAEQTYTMLPSDEHRRLTRALFMRLIDPGNSEQDAARRRAPLSEFDLTDPVQKQCLQETIDAFVKARLLTTTNTSGTPTIEVSHEALIREWKRVAEWVREEPKDIQLQQTISKDVKEWQEHEQSSDLLYRGSHLKRAREWAERNPLISGDEAAFLRASVRRTTRVRFSVGIIVLLFLLMLPGIFFAARSVLPPTRVQILTANVSDLAPVSAGHCTLKLDTYQCIIRLSSNRDSTGIVNWTASTDINDSPVKFATAHGILAPGQFTQVIISGIPCHDGSFTFSGNGTTAPAIILWKCTLAQERLNFQAERFTLTVNDINGLLSDSPSAINDIKQQVRSQPVLSGRNVGLAIVYAGAPDIPSTAQAAHVSAKIYQVLRSLGQEGGPFERASYYSDLYTLGSSANLVEVDVFLYVR